jgi:hypothetical protein
MPQASENTGIKVTIQHDFAGHRIKRTAYKQGDRKREEFRNHSGSKRRLSSGPRLAAIIRCDLGKIFELNLDAAEYVAAPYPPKPLTRAEMAARGFHLDVPASNEPTLRIETTTLDTGERKEFFGYIARHVVITRNQIPLQTSHSLMQELITDGWYTDPDFDLQLTCDPHSNRGDAAHAFVCSGNQPREIPEFVDIGGSERGFAVKHVLLSKCATPSPDGVCWERESKQKMVVTQLETGPLDPALFEIPAHFKLVEKIERGSMLP